MRLQAAPSSDSPWQMEAQAANATPAARWCRLRGQAEPLCAYGPAARRASPPGPRNLPNAADLLSGLPEHARSSWSRVSVSPEARNSALYTCSPPGVHHGTDQPFQLSPIPKPWPSGWILRTGSSRPRQSHLAAATPMRAPVKLPGPLATAAASTSRGSIPGFAANAPP